jgi:hypothetical protein
MTAALEIRSNDALDDPSRRRPGAGTGACDHVAAIAGRWPAAAPRSCREKTVMCRGGRTPAPRPIARWQPRRSTSRR